MRICFAALLFAAVLFAQLPTATLVGRVEDASRATIPGAAIRVRNLETGEVRTAQAQESGEFTVPNLPPGTYEVVVEKQGFRTLRETGLQLRVDQIARLDVRLEVGAVTEAVEVTARVPLLNTENASRGDVIVSNELTRMPLNGRDFSDLAFMVVGVQPAEQSSKGSGMSINGTRADATNFIVDGFNDQSPRDANAQTRPPLDALQEFKMQTSGYSAEYGRLAGGVMNVVLKTGGNQMHGTAFEFLRNDAFDARNFFDAGKSKLRRNQFGATLTGPVFIPKLYNGHDRTFFLAAWESYRGIDGNTQLGIVPTALERQGDFSQTRDVNGNLVLIKDPLVSGSCTATSTAACFPGNRIPAPRISPISLKIMEFYPLPNRPGQANNYFASANSTSSWNNFLFKVDHKLTPTDDISFRMVKRPSASADPYSGSGLGTFGSSDHQSEGLFGLAWIRMFTPAVINEFRTGLTRSTRTNTGAHGGHDYAADFGITGTTNEPKLVGFPKFIITNMMQLGEDTSSPILSTLNVYQWADTLTVVKAKHTLRIGADILRTQFFQPTNTNFRGTFNFLGRWTNSPFADFLLGLLNNDSRKVGAGTNYIFKTDYGFFVQDDFKVAPNLTLNLGLRYELGLPPTEKYGQMTNYVPSLGQIMIGSDLLVPDLAARLAGPGLTGMVAKASDKGLPASLLYPNYKNLAPRLGLAWRPFGGNRTVVRGGYGIFYNGIRLVAVRTDLTGNFPFAANQALNRQTNNPNMLTLANPFPASLITYSGVTNTVGYDLHAPTQYLQSWNLTIERDLGLGVGLEAGYTGSKGTHLGRKYNINQPLRAPGLQLPDGTFARPVQRLNNIDYYSFASNSSYNAATLSIRKRFERGMFFRVNYVYGKSIDDASGLNYAGAGGYSGAQDSRNLRLERGRSDFDIRHSLSMNFTYLLPLKRFWATRGWEVAGTGRAYSGQPFTAKVSNAQLDLGEANRPNRAGSGALDHPTPARWFNIKDFPAVPAGSFKFGNSGRNILNGPASMTFNLSLIKNVPIRERGQLQFRCEAFNAFNHTNFRLPNGNVDALNAATITGAQAARVMQLGLHLQF